MDQQRWQKVEEIVDTALTMDKPERKKYIQQECKGDKKLKNSVTELLQSIEESADTNYLEDPVQHQEFRNDFAETNRATTGESLVGQQIGVYKVTELIGHGGMGSVYTAERSDELHDQQLAIKILPRGMDSPSNIARFRREQQILAKLDHPNIARLLDGGVTNDGRPYLVMEYVNGTPLYEYCNEHQLSIEERLQLLTSLCQAVQHAHNNAVIHRDLKPSNILVTNNGDIKILDFGISKLLEPEDSSTTIFQTRTGARMFTLGYAAPEQIKGNTITTAADAYGLGVLFYELLSGVHPFDLENKSLPEIEQLIRKQTPKTVCSKYKQLPEEKQQQLAEHRDTTPPALLKSLSGDLEAIIMKALRKEPEARYNSAEQLLNDLQRYQQNLPVVAREDTWRYKTSKFFKRYKTGLSITVGFLMLVIGFAGFYTWQIAQERNEAQQEEQKARKTLEYLVGIFDYAAPSNPNNKTVTATQILNEGTSYIKNKIKKQPDIKASLMASIGAIYQDLGEYDSAKTLLHNALEINQKLYTKNNIDLANSLYNWGGYNTEVGNIDTALKYLKKSTEMYEKLGVKSKHAVSLSDLGWTYYLNAEYKKADSILSKALNIDQSVHGYHSKQAAWDLQYLGWIKNGLGQYEQADSLFQKSLSIRKSVLGENHRLVAQTLLSLGRNLYDKGKYKEAEKKTLQALNIQQQIFEDIHPSIASSLNILGLINVRHKDYKKAEQHFKKALNMRLELFGQNHRDVLDSRNDLATVYYYKSEYQRAAEMFKKVVRYNKKVRGPSHSEVATGLNNLAMSLNKTNRPKQALRYYEESINIARQNYPPYHPNLLHFRGNAAKVHEQLNQFAEASTLWLKNFRALKQQDDKNEQNINTDAIKNALSHLVKCYQQLRNKEKLEKYQALLKQYE